MRRSSERDFHYMAIEITILVLKNMANDEMERLKHTIVHQ
jgi:hypothetical protein